jgi:D-alanyl-D-alanine carboxypeptidase
MVKSDCYSRFISEMNLKAQALKMNKTHYSNSHGLINVNNRSTAYDIAVLSAYAMKNTVFREIVSCKVYNCTIKTYNSSPKLEELKEES